jgi:hypothetical protein
MKNLFQKLLGVALIACIALSLSSCEELFGEWSKPVPASVVQEAKVLGAALETGAKVSVNYSVGSKNYVATFIKNSDDSYTLISNDYISGARAMTRDASPTSFIVPTGDAAAVGSNIQLVLVGGKLQLSVKDTNGTPLFEARMDVEGGEVVVLNTNALGIDCSVGTVAVNDQPQPIKIPDMKTVNLTMGSGNSKVSYAVKYSQENHETWAAVIERYNNLDVVEIKANKDYISVMFSKDFVVKSLMEVEEDQASAEEMYNYHFSGEFYLTSNDPIAEGHSFVPKYVKTTDVVGIVDGQDQATYYLTKQVPKTGKQFTVARVSDPVTLNIPIGDYLTWGDIADANPNLYNENGKYYITLNDVKYYLYESINMIWSDEGVTYNPDASYIFRETLFIDVYNDLDSNPFSGQVMKLSDKSTVTWADIADVNSQISVDGDYIVFVRPEDSVPYRICNSDGTPIEATKEYNSYEKYILLKYAFENVTAADLGKVIGLNGRFYATTSAAETAGTTALAVIAYVGDAGTADASSASYKGLALALTDASTSAMWCTQASTICLTTQFDANALDAAKADISGIAYTDELIGHATHTHAAASAARDYNGGIHPTGTSEWFLPSAGQWEKMMTATGGYSNLKTIASLQSDDYWSSTEFNAVMSWDYYSQYDDYWAFGLKPYGRSVRSAIAF